MQQPAQNQQLPTPTGLTEVKTHGALLFRQTQITASSADCTRDEQTHINYRLNFAIHLSKARNISKTASITPTNPSPDDGATRETKIFRKKKPTTFSSHFPCCCFPPHHPNTRSKPRRAGGIKSPGKAAGAHKTSHFTSLGKHRPPPGNRKSVFAASAAEHCFCVDGPSPSFSKQLLSAVA